MGLPAPGSSGQSSSFPLDCALRSRARGCPRVSLLLACELSDLRTSGGICHVQTGGLAHEGALATLFIVQMKGEVRSHWVHEGSEGGPFRQWGGTGYPLRQDLGTERSMWARGSPHHNRGVPPAHLQGLREPESTLGLPGPPQGWELSPPSRGSICPGKVLGSEPPPPRAPRAAPWCPCTGPPSLGQHAWPLSHLSTDVEADSLHAAQMPPSFWRPQEPGLLAGSHWHRGLLGAGHSGCHG